MTQAKIESLQAVIDREYRLEPIRSHQENLRKTHELIQRLRKFTLSELKEAIQQENVGPFDVSQTLEDLLGSLVTLGSLKYEYHRYIVVE